MSRTLNLECPVRYTCSAIDEALDEAQALSDEINGDLMRFMKANKTALENLRSENAKLREWGEEMADRVRELEGEVEGLEATITELETAK